MTDRELLELAAKAAGMGQLVWGEKYKVGDAEVDCTDLPYVSSESPDESPAYWNPLTDDGDALRLAVKLGLLFAAMDHSAIASRDEPEVYEQVQFDGDQYAATRRAIVQAAAKIGRAAE